MPVVGAATAFVVTMVASPVVLRLVRDRLIDTPNARSSHDAPTARGGGISLAIGAIAGYLASGAGSIEIGRGVVAAALLLGAVGLIDDLRGLSAATRLGAQMATGLISLVWLLDGVDGYWLVAGSALTVVWVAAYTNVFNFMDGINGIAAAQAIVAGLALSVVGGAEELPVVRDLGLVIAFSSLAFAPWNFPRPRFFMGDVGSYFVGAWLATASIVAIRFGVPVVAVAAPLLLFLLDTSTTLVDRLRRGERWREAHRDHAYQRAVAAGWTHTRMTLTYLALSTAAAIAGLSWLSDDALLRTVGVGAMAISAAAYLMVPRIAAQR